MAVGGYFGAASWLFSGRTKISGGRTSVFFKTFGDLPGGGAGIDIGHRRDGVGGFDNKRSYGQRAGRANFTGMDRTIQ
jgi:hypothetical protein